MDPVAPSTVPARTRARVSRATTAVPRLSPKYLSRPRLVDALEAVPEDQVVLVTAPAGYGKTLLVADWVSRHPGRTAWVTLDGDDNDDRRFWSAVLAALGSCPEVPTHSTLRTMPVPVQPSRKAHFVAAVMEALDRLPGPITLILDDVHELTNGDPLHGLACLVRDGPRHLQLVLSTRLDPPLRLDRLRLTGRLFELRAPALAFTFEETRAVLAAAEVPARPDQVRVLLEQTEGWAAGVRLAALSMRGSQDPDLFLTDLVGNVRALSDYLVGEILSRLPVDVMDVLSAVSVCDRSTASLAVAVCGRDEAGDVLAALEQETSLVTSYGEGRRWFRVHPLLRAQLRADLQRRRPDVAAAVHARAARWFAAARDPGRALRHAGLARDPELMTGLLREHGLDLATSGHHPAVHAALGTLPAALVRADAHLALIAVLAHLEFGQLGAADRLLVEAETAWPADPTEGLVAMRRVARARRAWAGTTWNHPDVHGIGPTTGPADGVDSARVDSARVDTARVDTARVDTARVDTARVDTARLDTVRSPGMDVAELLLRANTAMARGRLHDAEAMARAAVDRADLDGNSYLAARSTVTLAVVAGLSGRIPDMVALAAQAEGMAPADGWRNSVGNAYAQFLLAYGALLQARPEESLSRWAAVDDVVVSLPAPTRAEINAIIPVLGVVGAAARFDLGEHRSALDALSSARLAVPEGRALDRPTLAFVALVEHGAATRLGMRAHARTVLDWAEDHVGPTGDVLLMRAGGPAAIRRYAAARVHLRPLLEGSVAPAVPWAVIDAWLLECRIALATDNRPRARHALQRTLEASRVTGVLRPLVGAPDDVADLVIGLLGELGDEDAVARQVLTLRATGDRHAPPAFPLTERERAVLDLLPTLMSLDEIADTLTVTVNTVKSHVRAIYTKLGVGSRREAVAITRRIGPSGRDDRVPSGEL